MVQYWYSNIIHSSYEVISEPHYLETEYLTNHRFNEFETIDENAILKLIKESKTKSCELDPAPTALLKQFTEVLVPSVHHIITTSLSHGYFTNNLKKTLLRILLKKSNLDLTFKNYYPVSNSCYLSKIVEKAVCNQITSFVAQTNNTEELQSVYCEDHSTETALLKVKTNLLTTLDNQEVCLSQSSWNMGYLKSQFWVPYYLYYIPVHLVTLARNMESSIIAMKMTCRTTSPSNQTLKATKEECIKTLELWIAKIRKWVWTNLLKLNNDKTEFLLVGTKQQLRKVTNINVKVGHDEIKPVSSIRNLGYHQDAEMKNAEHVNKLCKQL